MSTDSHSALPRIQLNLWDHKLSIALHWTALLISGGALPIILYFTLRYAAKLQLGTVLGITTAIFGVVTLLSLLRRTWALLKRSSSCRPLGGTRWQMDFFNWDFMINFICVAVIVVVGNVTKNVRVVALGLPVLLANVGAQLLIVSILAAGNKPCPIRMSSVPKGDRIRSGVYAIAEDIVAVDGGQGQVFRDQLRARYLASRSLRSLCFKLDIIWGVSGVAVGGAAIGLLFGLSNKNLAYILGWVIPWGYAGIMALVTIFITKAALKNEQADPVDDTSPQAQLMFKERVDHGKMPEQSP